MKNNKGFVIPEVLILSTVLIGILIFMYSQFKSINRSYQYSFKYDTVEGLYLANNLINYINEGSYDNLVLNLGDSSYLDITNCNVNYFSTAMYCSKLIEASEIEQVLFTKENLIDLKQNMDGLSEDFKDYIKNIKTSSAFNDYRLIIKYLDGTFASMRFNKGSYLAIPGEVMQDGKKYYDAVWVKNNPIYYNPVIGDKCDNYHIDNSISGFNGITTNGLDSNNTSNNTGCLKWYVYSENSDGTVNMILDHNTSSGVKWYTEEDNSKKAETALTKLIYGTTEVPSDTIGWVGVPTRNDKYEAKWKKSLDDTNYTTSIINYAGYKARLITAQEIIYITGTYKAIPDGLNINENDVSASNWYFFGGTGSTMQAQFYNQDNKSIYSWLFDNTYNCLEYGCEYKNNNTGDYGYWTATPTSVSENRAWKIDCAGTLGSIESNDDARGIRPVITISGEIIVK